MSFRLALRMILSMVFITAGLAGSGASAATDTTTTLTLAKETLLSGTVQTYTVKILPAPTGGEILLKAFDADGDRWRTWYQWDVEPGESIQTYQTGRYGASVRQVKAVYSGSGALAGSESEAVKEVVKLRPASLTLTIDPTVQVAEGTEVRVDWSSRTDETFISFDVTEAGDPGAYVGAPFPVDVTPGETSGVTVLPRIPPGKYEIRADLGGTLRYEHARVTVPFEVTGIPVTLRMELDHRYTVDGTNHAVVHVDGTDVGQILRVEVFKDDEPSTVYAGDTPFPEGGIIELSVDVGLGDPGPFHVVARTWDGSLYRPARADDWFWVGTPPEGEVDIEAGDTLAEVPDVEVDVPATDDEGVAAVRLANKGKVDAAGRLVEGRSQPYADAVSWDLDAGDCSCVVERSVWVQWRDEDGTWSQPKKDSIDVRSIPWPGTPVVRIRQAPVASTTSIPLTVRWNDARRGRTYGVSLTGSETSTVVAEGLTTDQASADAVDGGVLRARVQARDAQGRASAWIPSKPFTPSVVRAAAPAVHRSGRWSAVGDMLVTSAPGAKAVLVSKAQGLGVVARRGPGLGRLKVIIDGKTVATVSLAAASKQPPAVVWSTAWPKVAKHTIAVAQASGKVDLVSFAILK